MMTARADNRCGQCGRWLFWDRDIRLETCYDCRVMKSDVGEVDHTKFLRCPYCRHVWNWLDTDQYDDHQDGTREAQCPKCEDEFTFRTLVTYRFESPAIITQEAGG